MALFHVQIQINLSDSNACGVHYALPLFSTQLCHDFLKPEEGVDLLETKYLVSSFDSLLIS